MKSKSYFVDRIIKLRGSGDRDELMKLQMVDLLHMLNDERANQKPEVDDIAGMIPEEAPEEKASEEKTSEEKAPEEKAPEEKAPEEESSSDDDVISTVRRFMFTPYHKG